MGLTSKWIANSSLGKKISNALKQKNRITTVFLKMFCFQSKFKCKRLKIFKCCLFFKNLIAILTKYIIYSRKKNCTYLQIWRIFARGYNHRQQKIMELIQIIYVKPRAMAISRLFRLVDQTENDFYRSKKFSIIILYSHHRQSTLLWLNIRPRSILKRSLLKLGQERILTRQIAQRVLNSDTEVGKKTVPQILTTGLIWTKNTQIIWRN